jgi:predicted HicB family RNase H-like nuclease
MPVSKAQQKATMKYLKNNYDDLRIRIKKGNKAIIETAAKKENKSLNSYVIEAVDKQLTAGGNPSILENKDTDKNT